MARDVTMGMVDRGVNDADDKNDKKKSSRYSQSKAKTTRGVGGCWSRGFGPDLNKKRFALGTLIGEVKIPVTGLTPGETSDPMWLPIAPVRSDDDKVPKWLAPYGDRLGEICVATGAGFLREAPEDLVNPSDHWVLPTLGELEVRVLEVVGDPTPKDIASSWFGWGKNEDSATGAGPETENMLGADVSVQLLWEGRAEKVATPHEHRSFGVTDPASELRVLVLAEGPLAMDEVLLGAAVLPVRDVVEGFFGHAHRDGDRTRVDAWLDVIGPHRELSSSDMSDVNFRVRATRTRKPRGWRGRVRVSVGLVPKRAMHRWYLRQVARPRGEAYVDDTFKGVVASAERLVTAALAPVTAPLAAAAHTLSGQSPGLNNAWIAWHTALCLCARRHVLWAFFPLWCASGACFVGYACALADACDVPGRYTGRRVLRTMSVREVTSRSGSRRRATRFERPDSPVSKGSCSSVSRGSSWSRGSGSPFGSSRTNDDWAWGQGPDAPEETDRGGGEDLEEEARDLRRRIRAPGCRRRFRIRRRRSSVTPLKRGDESRGEPGRIRPGAVQAPRAVAEGAPQVTREGDARARRRGARRGAQGEGPEHQSRAQLSLRADARRGGNATSACSAGRRTI